MKTALSVLWICALALLLLFPASAQVPKHNHRDGLPDNHRNVLTAQASIGGIEEFGGTYGIEYEYFFTKQRYFSVDVPVSVYQAGTFGAAHSGQTRVQLKGYYVAPCFRYHPISNHHRVDPALGVALLLGKEKRHEDHYGSYYVNSSSQDEHLLGAFLGQLSINFQTHKYIAACGFFLTGGFIFSNTQPSAAAYNIRPNHKYGQFGFRIGGHW